MQPALGQVELEFPELAAVGVPADASRRSEPIIVADGLGKAFRLYDRPSGRLVEWLTFSRVRRHNDFWALRDVSFELARGESLGVIGVNGSGKSTLLKILSGALYPSRGRFDVNGRVLSLLELGTGLNTELTGRQNVLNSARLLGFPAEYAGRRMGQIEAFAELGEFFDRPVRLYSSGMLVRLSFSMFACFDPEVFIVDEALSVGDVFFQQKCVRRIEQMREAGVTMLFVSHDMQLVRRLCGRAILLSHGRVEFDGPPDECVSRYYSVSAPAASSADESAGGAAPKREPEASAVPADNDLLRTARSRHGAGALKMLWATLQDDAGAHTAAFTQTGSARLSVRLRALEAFARPTAGIHLYDRLGNLVFAAGTAHLGVRLADLSAGQELTVHFRLGLNVQPGEYTLSVGCSAAPPPGGPDVGLLQDQCEGIGPITVAPRPGELPPFHGLAALPFEAWV